MAARDYRIPIDLHGLELRNAVVHLLGSAPGSPAEGQIFYNTATHVFEFYNGTAWVTIGTLDQVSKAAADVDINTHKLINVTDPASAQDAATKHYVDGRSLDVIAAAAATAADVSLNGHKLTSVTDPASAQDAATKAYVDAQAAGARDVKDSVRLATTTALPAYTRVGNVLTANANGAFPAVDGVTLTAADAAPPRILLKNGAAGADNGVYLLTTTGSGGTPWVLTRATDANTSALVTSGLFVWATEGTANADTGWLLTTADVITLNTTALTFTQVSALGQVTAGNGLTKTGAQLDVGAGTGISVGADTVSVDRTTTPQVASADIGDGATTSITFTHNLNTRDCVISVYDKTTPFSEQYPEVRHTGVNTATLVFAVAPTAAQFRAVAVG